MLPTFLTAMGLSSGRHRTPDTDTKTLPSLWDKQGRARANISSEELMSMSLPPTIGQHVPEYSSPSSPLELSS